MRAGDLLGHRTQGAVALALELKTVRQDPDLDQPALVPPGEQGSGQREPHGRFGRQGPAGRGDPQVRRASQFLGALVDGLPAEEALELVRDAAEQVSPRSRPNRLQEKAEALRVAELERLGLRITRSDLIPGLTVHQAKGCEWPRVGVALSPTREATLAAGLRSEDAEHCVLYVALTRARIACGSLAHDDELDFADGP